MGGGQSSYSSPSFTTSPSDSCSTEDEEIETGRMGKEGDARGGRSAIVFDKMRYRSSTSSTGTVGNKGREEVTAFEHVWEKGGWRLLSEEGCHSDGLRRTKRLSSFFSSLSSPERRGETEQRACRRSSDSLVTTAREKEPRKFRNWRRHLNERVSNKNHTRWKDSKTDDDHFTARRISLRASISSAASCEYSSHDDDADLADGLVVSSLSSSRHSGTRERDVEGRAGSSSQKREGRPGPHRLYASPHYHPCCSSSQSSTFSLDMNNGRKRTRHMMLYGASLKAGRHKADVCSTKPWRKRSRRRRVSSSSFACHRCRCIHSRSFSSFISPAMSRDERSSPYKSPFHENREDEACQERISVSTSPSVLQKEQVGRKSFGSRTSTPDFSLPPCLPSHHRSSTTTTSCAPSPISASSSSSSSPCLHPFPQSSASLCELSYRTSIDSSSSCSSWSSCLHLTLPHDDENQSSFVTPSPLFTRNEDGGEEMSSVLSGDGGWEFSCSRSPGKEDSVKERRRRGTQGSRRSSSSSGRRRPSLLCHHPRFRSPRFRLPRFHAVRKTRWRNGEEKDDKAVSTDVSISTDYSTGSSSSHHAKDEDHETDTESCISLATSWGSTGDDSSRRTSRDFRPMCIEGEGCDAAWKEDQDVLYQRASKDVRPRRNYSLSSFHTPCRQPDRSSVSDIFISPVRDEGQSSSCSVHHPSFHGEFFSPEKQDNTPTKFSEEEEERETGTFSDRESKEMERGREENTKKKDDLSARSSFPSSPSLGKSCHATNYRDRYAHIRHKVPSHRVSSYLMMRGPKRRTRHSFPSPSSPSFRGAGREESGGKNFSSPTEERDGKSLRKTRSSRHEDFRYGRRQAFLSANLWKTKERTRTPDERNESFSSSVPSSFHVNTRLVSSSSSHARSSCSPPSWSCRSVFHDEDEDSVYHSPRSDTTSSSTLRGGKDARPGRFRKDREGRHSNHHITDKTVREARRKHLSHHRYCHADTSSHRLQINGRRKGRDKEERIEKADADDHMELPQGNHERLSRTHEREKISSYPSLSSLPYERHGFGQEHGSKNMVLRDPRAGTSFFSRRETGVDYLPYVSRRHSGEDTCMSSCSSERRHDTEEEGEEKEETTTTIYRGTEDDVEQLLEAGALTSMGMEKKAEEEDRNRREEGREESIDVDWKKRINTLLQPLMHHERMRRLVQNTWKLQGKEVEIKQTDCQGNRQSHSILCICDEIFRDYSDAFECFCLLRSTPENPYASKDTTTSMEVSLAPPGTHHVAVVSPSVRSSGFPKNTDNAANVWQLRKEYERLKTGSVECQHCGMSVHALCGGGMCSRLVSRSLDTNFYCCICKNVLFDPTCEVTWCSTVTSFLCPPSPPSLTESRKLHNDPSLSSPVALSSSASAAASLLLHKGKEEGACLVPGRAPQDPLRRSSHNNSCILPFSNSPVLQTELSSNTSAAIELRFFPYGDPSCGRHRPYIPDHLELFVNPPVATLATQRSRQRFATDRYARSSPHIKRHPNHTRLFSRGESDKKRLMKTAQEPSVFRRDVWREKNSCFLPHNAKAPFTTVNLSLSRRKRDGEVHVPDGFGLYKQSQCSIRRAVVRRSGGEEEIETETSRRTAGRERKGGVVLITEDPRQKSCSRKPVAAGGDLKQQQCSLPMATTGLDCSSTPDFRATYDPAISHLHPKPPLYLTDIKQGDAALKKGMNFFVARGHHRQSRLFLFQVVCSVAIEESQMLEAIVQRRSLPIPICTAFLRWIVAKTSVEGEGDGQSLSLPSSPTVSKEYGDVLRICPETTASSRISSSDLCKRMSGQEGEAKEMMRRKEEKKVSTSGEEVLQRKRSRGSSFSFLSITAATGSFSSLLHLGFSRPKVREQEGSAEEEAEQVKTKSSSGERSCGGIAQSFVDILPSLSKKTSITGLSSLGSLSSSSSSETRVPASSPAHQQTVHRDVLSVSLFNRDTAGRLRVPARSVHCRHAECFDLQFFIRTNYLRHCSDLSWKCPICEEYAFPNELYVDTLIQEILHVTDFRPPLKKAKTIAFTSQDLTNYTITECLEEDGEEQGKEYTYRLV
ncbi:miz sp-ring zinc finger domain-containing protein [Cystoisospora suis]|uniref:Miz sp-ring zinc finger domain-containing protein n=1 Tax=Cystoisospora suis TaxID=483139 RepID=A0A2C6LB77_9APIC|nr:miz sp-ring zinc finger domain-containing protein [Cystoisospora suis]